MFLERGIKQKNNILKKHKKEVFIIQKNLYKSWNYKTPFFYRSISNLCKEAIRYPIKKFANASTGIPIKKLSGAACENAIFAKLGGGTLERGGLGVTGGVVVLEIAGQIIAISSTILLPIFIEHLATKLINKTNAEEEKQNQIVNQHNNF